jgi:hypothetical protein
MNEYEFNNDIADAADAYEAFHGEEATIVTEIDDFPQVFAKVGDAVGIVYEVIEDGALVRYQHDFDARPTLAISSDGKTAVILRGGWQFTDRGFEG